jgi:toxin-antitoxin system PIN domain toxin
MNGFLLDVNVLVALAWPGHQFHERVQQWFAKNSSKGWSTCPITQAGFVRIISNQAFSPRAVSPQEAVQALSTTVRHPHHRFWADDLSVADALPSFQGRLSGHQQVTDAYLLALAIHKGGKLATLDTNIAALLGERSPEAAVELIRGRT